MKLYHLHENGTELGPFTIDELKGRNLQKTTPVWHEGLAGWTTAGELSELSSLFKTATPPPFKPVFATAAGNTTGAEDLHYQSAMEAYFSDSGSKPKRKIWIMSGLLLLAVLIAVLMYRQTQSNEIINDLNMQLSDTHQREAVLARQAEAENEQRASHRRDWDRHIKATYQNPRIDYTFGGISAFNTVITNRCPYMLEEVELTVRYIRKNGDVWQQKKLSFTNIAPGSSETMVAPSSTNGVSVEMDITKVVSKEMQFCYPHGRGPADDLYVCR